MGLLAEKRVLLILIFFGMMTSAQAGEDLFHLTMVDYFGAKACKKGRALAVSTWVEPGYRPPQVVMDLLDDPNEQTALQYLRWHRDRLEKLARAQEILQKVGASLSDEVRP
jgi:hypothetical protein